jgi:hypothetical protein
MLQVGGTNGARVESVTVTRSVLRGCVDQCLATDLSGLAVDATDLHRVSRKVVMSLERNDPSTAARMLRAWASMALAMVGRIEWSRAYQSGVADAITKMNEPIDLPPLRGTTKTYSGGKRGRKHYVHDCGSFGRLTLPQMASTAGCSEPAIRNRLRSGLTPEQSIVAGAVLARQKAAAWRELRRQELRDPFGLHSQSD